MSLRMVVMLAARSGWVRKALVEMNSVLAG